MVDDGSSTRQRGVSSSCGLSSRRPILLLDVLTPKDRGASSVCRKQEGRGRPTVLSIDADGSRTPFSASFQLGLFPLKTEEARQE